MSEKKLLEQYSKDKESLISIMDKLPGILDKQYSHFVNGFEQLKKRLKDDRIWIMVVGEFKAGKSTFINALLGEELLPTWNREASAAIIELRKGSEDKINMVLKSGEEKEISKEELREQATVDNPDYEKIRKFVVDYKDSEILNSDVIFIDTPGTNSADLTRQEITLNYLPKMDVALFMMSGERPYTESEQKLLVNDILPNSNNNIFFILNKCEDELEDGSINRIVSRVKTNIMKDYPGIEKIYPISSEDALNSILDNKPELWQKSNIDNLIKDLFKYINENKHNLIIKNISERLVDDIEKIVEDIEFKMSAIRLDKDELEIKIRESEPVLNNMLSEISSIQEQTKAIMNKLKANLVRRLDDMKEETYAKLHSKYGESSQHHTFDKVSEDIIAETRYWIDSLNNEWKFNFAKIKKSLAEYFSGINVSISNIKNRIQKLPEKSIETVIVDINPDKIISDEVHEIEKYKEVQDESNTSEAIAAAGGFGVVGAIAGTLLGGPAVVIGIFAALFGFGMASSEPRTRLKKFIEKIIKKKVNLRPALNKHFTGIRENLDKMCANTTEELLKFIEINTTAKVKNMQSSIEDLRTRKDSFENEGIDNYRETIKKLDDFKNRIIESY